MRAVGLMFAGALLLQGSYGAAQPEKPYTDRTVDHLAGPVRSAVTKTSFRPDDGSAVRLPDGPAVVEPVMRLRCEYDPDGNRTLAENQQKTGPYGELVVIARDANGHVTERRSLDRQTGALTRWERFGRYGVIDDLRYWEGKVTNEFVEGWDEHGHRSTFVAKDGEGKEVSHSHSTYTADGVKTEETNWAANGTMQWRDLYDPATGTEEFRNYDAEGGVRLSLTTVHDRLIFFRALEDHLYGSTFGPRTGLRRDVMTCHVDGGCDHMVSEYPDEESVLPKSTELRGPTGLLKAGAYFEYVLDGHGNWTSRTVRVKVRDTEQPQLYEEDARMLVYWPER